MRGVDSGPRKHTIYSEVVPLVVTKDQKAFDV